MPDLTTNYLGLTLRNPVIIGSSGLTKDEESVKACEDAGAGAVVLKSIFEEQIREDFQGLTDSITDYTYHPAAYEYFRADLAARYGAHEYCQHIEAMEKAVEIPVIASIHCYSDSTWITFAGQVEDAGAQALELNVSFPPIAEMAVSAGDHMQRVADAVQSVTERIQIPVTVKIPPVGAFVYPFAQKLIAAGAKGLVMFNRFLVPEIDIETMTVKAEVNYSDPPENDIPRRFIALLRNRLECDLIAATGVHGAEDAISMLLVGANAVQVVSTVYHDGYEAVDSMCGGIENWMRRHTFDTLDQFRGKLAVAPEDTENPFGRFQFIKTVTEQLPAAPSK